MMGVEHVEKSEKRKKRDTDRMERLDWMLTIGEIAVGLFRMIWRLFRRVFDW